MTPLNPAAIPILIGLSLDEPVPLSPEVSLFAGAQPVAASATAAVRAASREAPRRLFLKLFTVNS